MLGLGETEHCIDKYSDQIYGLCPLYRQMLWPVRLEA